MRDDSIEGGQAVADFLVEGVHCAGCVSTVERALREGGADEAALNVTTGEVRVRFDSETIELGSLVQAIERTGYKVPRETIEVSITGMHCAGCVGRVEGALAGVAGVTAATVNLVESTARVELLPGAVAVADLAAAVEHVGYALESRGPEATTDPSDILRRREEEREEEYRDLLRRFRVGLALGLPVLLIGHWELIPGLPTLSAPATRLLWAISGVLTVPIMTYVGRRFFTGAWNQLKHKSANMDTLVSLGTGAAWLYSTAVVLLPEFFPENTGRPFYEAAAVVITLVVLGQALEARAKGRTSGALRRLMDLRPRTARVLRDGTEVEIPATELGVGDVVILRPGETVPMDGDVIEGMTSVDESMLTGESIPVTRGPGDAVVGGTLVQTGSINVRVTSVGGDTVLAHIVDMVRTAQSEKPPIQRTVDVVAGWFVPAVVSIAVITFGIWFTTGPEPRLNYAMVVSVAVLVIACPCALGLATPISIMVSVGKAAEHGILIRNGEAMQVARRVDTVVLDKTGTVTRGEPQVAEVVALEGSEGDLLDLAARAEAGSEHPLARAIVQIGRRQGAPAATAFEAVPGRGIRATVDGRAVRVGTRRFLEDEGVDPGPLDNAVGRMTDAGRTPVLVSVDGQVSGAIGLADVPKSDSAAAVAALKERGLRVVMLTGDNRRTAQAIAAVVGIDDVRSEVLPDEKAAVVRDLQGEGAVVMMVGDGINDAPALAQADVGVALGTGTDVAMEAADLTLMGESLLGVATALDLSQATFRNIRQNLVGAFVYNVLGIPVAAGILYPLTGMLLSPMIAGAAMAFSSVTVVTNANRLHLFRPSAQTRNPA